MLENGVPIRPVGFCNVNEMFEINTEQADSIEVLRGPSNSLYGSSAVHGAVNVLQAAPADRSKLRGGVDAGPDQYRRIKLAARALGDRTSAGVAALYAHDGGWRASSGFDEGKLNATLAISVRERRCASISPAPSSTSGFITGQDAYRDEALSATDSGRDLNIIRRTLAHRRTPVCNPSASQIGMRGVRPTPLAGPGATSVAATRRTMRARPPAPQPLRRSAALVIGFRRERQYRSGPPR